ncbi:MAG: hypothetical protein JNM90_24195 [Burkholderiales bacterium]|nr:hypothetical protein [Burkholderiales bacterium]
MSTRRADPAYWRGGWVRFREPVEDVAVCRPTVVAAHDGTLVRGLYWTPRSNPRPRVAVIAAHPRVDFSQHYAFPALLRAGYACLGANTRALNNDVNCVHEQLLLDLAAYMTWLRAQGVGQVVWLGNSGGGALGCFYQAQAKMAPSARLAVTPAGRPVALAEAEMPAVDAMMIVSAHCGQGLVLAETIDPAVTDEDDALASDPALDMYDPANGFAPPPAWSRYSAEFVARYRAAQRARVARIDARARELIDGERQARAALHDPGFAALPLAAQRAVQRRAAFQPVMTIYRTLANLHYVDRSLDPSPRGYGSLVSDRPHLANYQLAGFARLQTPDAWLSTWSAASSNAGIPQTAAAVTEPVLVATAGRDLDVYPRTHTATILAALGSGDRTVIDFPDSAHYFEPADGEAPAASVAPLTRGLVAWLAARCPL